MNQIRLLVLPGVFLSNRHSAYWVFSSGPVVGGYLIDNTLDNLVYIAPIIRGPIGLLTEAAMEIFELGRSAPLVFHISNCRAYNLLEFTPRLRRNKSFVLDH